MGVAVLHPQDCLRSHYPHHQPLLSHPQYNYKPRRNPNPNVNTTPNLNAVKYRRTKRSPNGSPSPSPPQSKPSSSATSPGVGQIRILKRGEDLSPVKQPPQLHPQPHPQRLPVTVSLSQQQQKKVSQSGRDSSKKVTKKNQTQQPKGAFPVVAGLSPGPKSVVKGMVPQKVMPFPIDAFYAGSSVFVASPPPSSLPLPAFFTSKKKAYSFSDIEDVASTDLRRLLKLDDL